jgi:hypothetical protein
VKDIKYATVWYRLIVPRPPKDFEVAWISIEPREPKGYLRTGPDTAVPAWFGASIALEKPRAAVMIEVFVGADLRPYVSELTIRANVQTPITTSVLRQILVDQLLREAMAKASVPAAEMEAWLATLPAAARAPGENPSFGRAEEDARRAAAIYAEAVAAGSRAPAAAVATVMNRSRSQAARYIRNARELGLLPTREGT